MKKILLIDGNSLLFRAYHASAATGTILRTKAGIPTNAVFSFASMIFKALNDVNYYDVKIAFDKGKQTFRHDMMEGYKEGRKPVPEDLIPQFKIVRDFLTEANIDWYEVELIEADDIIGTLAKRIEQEEDCFVEILTNDKDLFQLISDKTHVITPVNGMSKTQTFDKMALFEKWQITPEQVPELKGLMGDKSDNLKGVPGIGEKGAIKLIGQFNTIEGIYEHIDEIKGAQQINLINNKTSAFLTRDVALIKNDVELDYFELKQYHLNTENIADFFQTYEMFSLIKRIPGHKHKVTKENIEIQKISSWSSEYECDQNYIYVESIEENYHKGKIIGIGIINEKGNFYLNFETEPKQLTLFDAIDTITEMDQSFANFLNNASLVKKTYDIKRTIRLLENKGYKVNYDAWTYDMMVASYCINANCKSNLISHARLFEPNIDLLEDEQVYGKGIKRTADINLDNKAEFILTKTNIVKKLEDIIIGQLEIRNQMILYKNIELQLVFTLLKIEQNGVLINKLELQSQTQNIKTTIEILEKDMHEIVPDLPQNFNFASPKQINELLFEQLGLPSNKKKSTDKDILEKLVSSHPIVNKILEHRKLSKLYSTYLAGFEKFIFDDSKIHTIFNQTLTNTGRLSSSEPNIQNISIRDELQKEMRKIFITDKNTIFYALDYSQIELRVLAQMSKDKTLLDIFHNNKDVHDMTARKIYKLNDNATITSEQRRLAKIFNFGIIYGLTDFGLSKDLDIPIYEAKEYIEGYFAAFPEFVTFKHDAIEQAQKKGYANTFSNRQRDIEELTSANYMVKEFGKRIAVNMPIQGGAADIMKVAMVDIDRFLTNKNAKTKMVAQIHDEIILEVPSEEQGLIAEIEIIMNDALVHLLKLMKKNIENIVPLKVNISTGTNWYQLK